MTGQHADVVVVGAGPAGLAAAVELRRLGVARVVVLDREHDLGGVPRHTHHTGYGLRDLHRVMSGPAYARYYLDLARQAGVETRTDSTALDWVGETGLLVTSPRGLEEWRSRAVVLATGCRERPRTARLVPGDRPAGVFTTGALQQFVDVHRLPVGRRAVVVGAEHVSFSAVHTLVRAGVRVAAVVTDALRPQAYQALRWVTTALRRVPVLTDTEVVAVIGRSRVSAVRLRHRGTARTWQLDCDTVVFTGDWIADNELSRRGGIAIQPASSGPVTDGGLRTTRTGVFAVGNLVHAAETADVAALTARHAAPLVRDYLGGGPWTTSTMAEVDVKPPLRWVFPARLDRDTPPPRGKLLLRSNSICGSGRLEVWQGERLLHQQRRRFLLPNRSIEISASWLQRLDGEERLSVRWTD